MVCAADKQYVVKNPGALKLIPFHMKKISRNIFFLVIILIVFLGLAPRLLFLDEVQERVTSQISKSLGSSLTIKKMHWVWLPLPHLTLVTTNINNADYYLSLPRVNVYPTWRIIFGKTDKPVKIQLDSPEIRIYKTAFLPVKPSGKDISTSIPEMPISIKNGTLEIEFSEEYKDVFYSGSLTFNNIRGNLKLQTQEVNVDINASAPFSKNISLKGNFNMPEKAYRFSFDSRELKLHKFVKAFLKGNLQPAESTARLSGTVSGTGLQHIEGNLHGTLPCFAVKQQNREILLTCGFADLKLLKSGPLLRLDINDLEIKDPQVNLSGYIERKLSVSDEKEQAETREPYWTLDIIGTDLDLTTIRRKVLTLWPENSVAKIVCNVVRGGKALSAAYRFSGITADFKNMDAMIIEADVLNADIHVPAANLDLTGANGPILIKDSALTGNNLSARLGKSYGRNGELLLDLGKHDHRFKLTLDIDADLKDLPPILDRLVKHDGFQQQLAKFNAVDGTASGTLNLGDSLKNITTRVDVRQMNLAAGYAPIPRKIVIAGGSLAIGPGRVSWQKAKGSIGRQEISSTSGFVSWQSGDPVLNITEAQAQLDGTSLLALLEQTEVLPQQIKNMLSSLNGTIGVTRGYLAGPAFQPRSWEYDFDLTSTGLVFSSPLLPEPARTEELSATVRQGEADIQETAIHFLEQTFSISGLFKHQHLENWHGMIEFNGPVKSKLAEWISSRGWFPDRLNPRIPCTMKNLKIDWQGETVAVSGNVLQGLAGGRLPMARLDYENSPEHLLINEISFYAPGEQGRLKLDFWRRSPKKVVLAWQGFVNAETIDVLFENSPLTDGSFSGDLEIQYFADQLEKTRFVGLLKTENLLLKTKKDEEPIIITNLDMTGLGRQLTIPALGVVVGPEKITGSGQIMAEKDVLQLDINLDSPSVSKQSIARLSEAMHESWNFFSRQTDQKPEFQTASWDINGRIGFDFDSFSLSRETNLPYEGARSVTYTFHDVHGDMQLAPDKISRTEIFSAQLCGLGFKGFWFSDANLGQRFQIFTDPEKTLRMEKVLPCLGVQQDIIEGDFSLKANLHKESNTWYAGNIYLRSSQGRILRLKTLSRIFKVVNVTDLFEEQVQNTGKRGFPFSRMDIDTHIDNNNLLIDRAIILGEGLNLFARGEIDLVDYDADLSLLIAPFKTFDTIISKVPLIGTPVMGEYGSRVNIPVSVKGPINNPTITPLHPEAVGKAFLNIVKDTFMLPYNIILKPLEQSVESTGPPDSEEK